MTERPCITTLIDDLSRATEDHEASTLVRSYSQSLRDCGAVTTPRSAWPAIVSANTDDILSLLRAAYLDGVTSTRQRPALATVADALPTADHEAETRVDRVMAERYTAEERRPIGCAHEHTARGPDIPLRYGSWRSEVCQTCGLWRPMGHSPHAPVGDGLWSEGSLEEAAKPLEEF